MDRSRILVGGVLYFGLMFAVSMQFENISKNILKGSVIAGLNSSTNSLKPRQFDRTDYKLLSVSPDSENGFMNNGEMGLDALAYDTNGGAGTWADKIDQGQAILKDLKQKATTLQKEVIKPEPVYQEVTLRVATVMSSGIVSNGKYYSVGDDLTRGYNIKLLEVNGDNGTLTLLVNGKRTSHEAGNGPIKVIVKS